MKMLENVLECDIHFAEKFCKQVLQVHLHVHIILVDWRDKF